MKTSVFDFHLPEQLIAQEPLPERDASRLLVLNRASRTRCDSSISALPGLLEAGDLLILNNTRVIPARLRGIRDSSGGKVEFLLLPPEPGPKPEQAHVLRRVLTRSGGTLRLGERFTLAGGCAAVLRERHGVAGDVVEFCCTPVAFEELIERHGEVPLPPYIRRTAGPSGLADQQRYQTVYAQVPGAVAAPTAGFHFSQALFDALKQRGITWRYITLHVGPGTFRPVKADEITGHFMDPEPYTIPAGTLKAIQDAKREGRRVIAVGTTSLRALEGALGRESLDSADLMRDLTGKTDLFIYPPYTFGVVDGLLTNFHIPKSSLLMLVCAFASPGNEAGIEFVKNAYEHAVASKYRFYSYGDACLII